MSLTPGSLLDDRYRLLAEVGRGGMGTIYRARDQALERDVAVKVLSPSDLGTAGKARLVHEARAAAQLNHPNIVTVHDVGEADDAPFIVMEYVEGTSLHDERPSSLPDLIRVAAQVCTALDHAHRHGIVHRDLKPENIVVAEDGTAKLTDFGLALPLASRTTSEGAIAGTVFYLAPEQALGLPLDGRADLYALGVILYEIAAGRLPFVADDPLAVISQHLYSPVVLPTTYNDAIPPALETLIVRLMAKQPDDRPASAADVHSALLAIDTSRPTVPGSSDVSLLERIDRGRMVGRDTELQRALSSWQQAVSGQSQVLLISGEPGVGKSRLARELAAQAMASGGTVLIGECFADARAPYAPISQMIDQAVERRGLPQASLPPFVLADLMTLAPGLRARHPAIPAQPPVEPQVEQQRLAESVVILVSALCQAGPLLMLMEDAHWADGATLSLLRHLAHRADQPRLRLLVVLTYREVEFDEAPGMHEIELDLNRHGLAIRIRLAPLNREQTEGMLATLFQEEITREFLDEIYRQTEGNPFFIEEVCKALIDQGVLRREGGRWRRPRMGKLKVPRSIRVAMRSRLANLPREAREVVLRCAVFGREFDFQLALALNDLDEARLVLALEAAERAQLIEEAQGSAGAWTSTGPRLRFRHALIPPALLEDVSLLRRRGYHRRAAQALERIAADDLDAVALRTGRHFAQAGEADRAAEYLIRAGDHANRLHAYEQACEAYAEALHILRQRGETASVERTLLKLGALYHATYRFAESHRAYQEAFALLQAAPGRSRRATPKPASRAFRATWRRVETIDPAASNFIYDTGIMDQLFSGLVELNASLEILPDLARSWEVHDDGRRYTFHLRPEARWTDGSPVTSEDFRVAWGRVLDPKRASPNARFLYDIEGARAHHAGESSSLEAVGIGAIDPLTLEIRLEAPSGGFLHLLANYFMYPIPARLWEKHGDSLWQRRPLVGNGPFLLEAWDPESLLVLTRNPAYTGRAEGNLQRIELVLTELRHWYEDWEEMLARFEQDQLTVLGVPRGRRSLARHRHPGAYISVPMANTECLLINQRRPPFDDLRLRRALAHVINRDSLAALHLAGNLPATGGTIPVGLPAHSPGIALPFDPDLARSLMAEAGYPGARGLPETELAAWEAPDNVGTLEHLVLQWKEELGLKVQLWTAGPKAYETRLLQDPPHLAWGSTLAGPDPDDFLREWLTGFGDLCWHPEALRLAEQAHRSSDTAARRQLNASADRLLIESAVLVPVAYGGGSMLIKDRVRRLPMSPVRLAHWKDTVIDD